MNYFIKISVFEVQASLFWILGVLILHLGTWHWVGWLSIVWGWFTFVTIFVVPIRYSEEI